MRPVFALLAGMILAVATAKMGEPVNRPIVTETAGTEGCQFYPPGEYLRFVRVPENVPVGGEVLQVEVHPRRNLSLQPVDKADDRQFFSYQEVNSNMVSVTLAKSLEDLVDNDSPQNVLKFRLVCDYDDGEDTISSYLSVTVYVEDVNDHAPEFIDAPYHVTVDELTPTGLTIFRGIHAVDHDKPNTPNSDVQYSIVEGNENGKFALESSHRAALVVKRPLDFDTGDRHFELTLMASDRGTPPRNSTTTIQVTVLDNDDLSPKFARDLYRTHVAEFYPLTGERIHQELIFSPPILAFDQDLAIDIPVRYDIIAGNDRRLFSLDAQNGSLFLDREIDLDKERNLPGNTFVLQIQASQVDNPLKTGVARVEVEVLDLNDNLPEFEVDLYNISIVENLPNGFSVLQVIATDRDQGDNGEFTYQLHDPSRAFIIDPRTGWLTVRDQGMLDREKQASLGMTVYAREKVPSVVNPNANMSLEMGDPASVAVEVTLLDANDNNPTFVPSNVYEFKVEGDAQIGDTVGKVTAMDPDLGRNGMVLYELQRTSNMSFGISPAPFAVEAQTGHIVVIDSPLTEGRHALFIEASDQPSNPSERRFSLAVVTVQVLRPGSDGHGQEPDFIGAPYEFWVGANVAVGTSVGQIRVTDVIDKNHIIYDMLHSYHEGVPFAVEERSGTITVVDDVAKFRRSLYDFEAVVTNGQELTLVTNITIHVVDLEDDKDAIKKTSGSPMEFRVQENLSGTLVGQLLNTNNTKNSTDLNRWKSLHFIIANQQDVMDKFAVSQDGTIYTQNALDREEKDSYRLTIIAENNRGIIRGHGLYLVNVVVQDENDNAPKFKHMSYQGNIQENSLGGTEVSLNHPIQASDADIGENALFTMKLTGEDSDMFTLDQASGKVFVKDKIKETLDREKKSVYALKVLAQDKGNLSSAVNLTIYINDENDNAPYFFQMIVPLEKEIEVADKNIADSLNQLQNVSNLHVYNISHLMDNRKHQSPPLVVIPENAAIGTSILKLIANDKDSGANAVIKYSILSETFTSNITKLSNSESKQNTYFTIHPTNGEVSVARTLSPEREFHINVTATDGGGLKDNITIKIYCKDVNDNVPTFKKSWYNFDLPEGHYLHHVLGVIEATDVDHGENAKISYAILQNGGDSTSLPFSITEEDGVLSAFGEIDREVHDSYKFRVIAQDHGPINQRQRSTVDVEIHIMDINDNAPMFYGHEEIMQISYNTHDLQMSNNIETSVPIYHSVIVENSPVGTFVSKILANDSDFAGNGNGLLLFDIPRRLNPDSADIFAIDSKEGIITTIGKVDYETKRSHNVTIVASDLGKPSLSSTAILVVTIIDIADETEVIARPMFAHRYYEVEVEENCVVPVALLALNVTEPYKGLSLNFSIVPSNNSNLFDVDSQNGTLYLVVSPDREKERSLEVKVQAQTAKRGRSLPVMLYPVPPERVSDLASNEVKIIVHIKDVNDNPPRFTSNGRPIVAAIPTTANYGYQIVRLQAFDKDEGVNAEIRYQILGRVDDESHKFTIDTITGQVRSIVSFARDAGRVYGFDVKATDKRGADDGKSSIANVFVYILDEDRQLVMVVGSKPTTVERNMKNITMALYNATGLDVRIRKLEPHLDRDFDDVLATDLYLYAVDPLMNAIIDTDTLQHVLSSRQTDIKHHLERYRVLEITSAASSLSKVRSQRYLLSSLEVGVVVLGCVVFIGALAAAICVGCVRRGKQRRQQKGKTYPTQVGFTITNPQNTLASVSKSHLFPSYLDGLGCGDTTDTYVDMHSNKSLNYNQLHIPRHTYHPRHQHDINCSRHHHNRRRSVSGSKLHLTRTPSNVAAIGLEASMNSLHSSGKDSGIVDGMRHADHGRCICGHSTSHSSGDSSNYEDSLKSITQQHSSSGGGNHRSSSATRRSNMAPSRRRQRHNSSSGELIQQTQPPPVSGATLVRRQSDRNIVCQLTT